MKPAQLLAAVAVVSALIGLAGVYLASSADGGAGSFTVPALSFLFFGVAFVCGVGLVVLWGVADLLNQHRELNARAARDPADYAP